MTPSILQAGKQTLFAKSYADITIFGGAAGSSKTEGLIRIPVRHLAIPQWRGCIIRKKRTDISKSGGLFDQAMNVYKNFCGKPNGADLKVIFPSGAQIQFLSLLTKKDVDQFLSFNFDWIGYDELQLADEESWMWAVQGRLRSTIPKYRPYFLGTCNPYPHWLADLLDWWIDEDGYADESKCNVTRWLLRIDEKHHWFDTRQEAIKWKMENNPKSQVLPTSINFIPAKVTDNKILMDNDPHYVSRLASQNLVQRERLLKGNWKIVESGNIFNLEHFQRFLVNPPNFDYKIITVDTALETGEANDYTVMQCWGRHDGKIYLVDQFRGKIPLHIQESTLISLFNSFKPQAVYVEKAATGIPLINNCRRAVSMPILPIVATRATPGTPKNQSGKYLRVNNALKYIESGFVFLNHEADYYAELIQEISLFAYDMPATVHDDQVDAMIYAIQILLIEKQGVVPKKQEAPPEAFVTTAAPVFEGIASTGFSDYSRF